MQARDATEAAQPRHGRWPRRDAPRKQVRQAGRHPLVRHAGRLWQPRAQAWRDHQRAKTEPVRRGVHDVSPREARRATE